MTTSPRLTASFLSLSLVLASILPAVPAVAENVAAPVRLAPTVAPIKGVNFSYNPAAEIPQAGAASNLQLPGAAQIANIPVTMEATLPAPLAQLSNPILEAQTTLQLGTASFERRPFVTRVKDAVLGKTTWHSVFDRAANFSAATPGAVYGIRPLPTPTLPSGLKLDPPPSAPSRKKVPGITVEGFFAVPGAKTQGGVFEAGPRLLNANPNDAKDVERALRELVDADAARYGLTSAELTTIHSELSVQKTHQTETVYVFFNQTRELKNPDGTTERVAVHGTRLSFTVKNIDGRAVLYSSMGQLYPKITVDTNRTLTDAQLKAKAEARLGVPANSPFGLTFVERKIIYSDNAWHAANLYVVEGFPVMVAVDVASGEAFAWDPRHGFEDDENTPTGKAVAKIKGRGEANDERNNGQPVLTPLDMNNLDITLADGRKVVTNKKGELIVDSKDGSEVSFAAALEGTYARIVDSQGRSLKLNGAVKPGTSAEFVYNPKDAEEWVYNMINTFQGINRVHDWLYERFPDKRIQRAITGNVNIDQECNAFYHPGAVTLNFFKSSANCSDTARPGIIAHEYGHFWDDMIGGIINGGLSEGWGDILSMFLFGSPIIGDGFLKNTGNAAPTDFLLKRGFNAATLHSWADAAAKVPFIGGALETMLRPSYLRHGENTYQYDANDEVHQQGQAWMGFAWKLRKALIAKLGQTAGAALAESLIIPTMLAKAGDIPSAMAQVLLNDMDKNGVLHHEAEIRAAAKAHGIDLPAAPGKITGFGGDGGLAPLAQFSADVPKPQKPAAKKSKLPVWIQKILGLDGNS